MIDLPWAGFSGFEAAAEDFVRTDSDGDLAGVFGEDPDHGAAGGGGGRAG